VQTILWGQLVSEAEVLSDPCGGGTLHGSKVYLTVVGIRTDPALEVGVGMGRGGVPLFGPCPASLRVVQTQPMAARVKSVSAWLRFVRCGVVRVRVSPIQAKRRRLRQRHFVLENINHS
jgi:hypothetical protein